MPPDEVQRNVEPRDVGSPNGSVDGGGFRWMAIFALEAREFERFSGFSDRNDGFEPIVVGGENFVGRSRLFGTPMDGDDIIKLFKLDAVHFAHGQRTGHRKRFQRHPRGTLGEKPSP